MIKETRLLMGHCPEDSRLKEVAELLRLQLAECDESVKESVSYEAYDMMLKVREQMYTGVMAYVRVLLGYDHLLSTFKCAAPPMREELRGVEAAIRAAAPYVKYGADWAALLRLCREKGIEMTETELAMMVARTVPHAPQCSRQILNSAWWDTNRHRFPDWQPEGISRSKFERQWAVANAANAVL